MPFLAPNRPAPPATARTPPQRPVPLQVEPCLVVTHRMSVMVWVDPQLQPDPDYTAALAGTGHPRDVSYSPDSERAITSKVYLSGGEA